VVAARAPGASRWRVLKTPKISQKRKAAFKARFIQTRRRQVAAIVPLGGALLLLARAGDYVGDIGMGPTALGILFLLAAGAGFTWLNWRCPRCRWLLDTRLNPDRCRRCGVELTDR